jgi:hypothetical protein
MWPLRRNRKRPAALPRQLAHAALGDAMGRVQAPPEPPRIHNPFKGTWSHYRDPDQAAARPVCKASGHGWAEGDGGLALCGLCPYMWAQRQDSSEEGRAS